MCLGRDRRPGAVRQPFSVTRERGRFLASPLCAVRARDAAPFGAAQDPRARCAPRGVRAVRRRSCASQRDAAEAAAMMLHELAAVSAAVAATRSRSEKVRVLAECLRALEPDERETAVAWLSGVLRGGKVSLGRQRSMRRRTAPAAAPSLTIAAAARELDALRAIAGKGSAVRREQALDAIARRGDGAGAAVSRGAVARRAAARRARRRHGRGDCGCRRSSGWPTCAARSCWPAAWRPLQARRS